MCNPANAIEHAMDSLGSAADTAAKPIQAFGDTVIQPIGDSQLVQKGFPIFVMMMLAYGAGQAMGAGAGASEGAEPGYDPGGEGVYNDPGSTASAGGGEVGSGYASAAPGAASTSSTIVSRLAGYAINQGISYVISSLLSPKKQQGLDQAARGALVNDISNVAPIPVIYGTRRCGGTRILTETSGASNEFLHLVIVWGEGPISAVSQVYLDGVAITDARFAGFTYREDYLGSDTQAASPALIAALGNSAKWNANCTLSGIAYSYIRLQWDRTAFATGLPNITADIDGRTLYDPRTGATAFSHNPALAIRDYLTNARYGRGIDAATMIDDASFKEAAYYCDDQVAIPGGATQARYTADGLINVDNKPLDNLRELLSSCRGMVVFTGGQYRLKMDRGHWGLLFDGATAQRVTLPDPVRVALNGANWTITGWARSDDVAPSRTLLGPRGVVNGRQISQSAWAGAGRISFAEEGIAIVPATDFAIANGELFHYAWTYDGASIRTYKNGVLVNGPQAYAFATPCAGSYAYSDTSGLLTWKGMQDGGRIYSRCLSTAEIGQQYRGGFSNETGLVGRWEFDEGQGTTAYDWSGSGNNGTLINGPTYTGQVPGPQTLFTLNQDNILGAWSFSTPGKRTKFNRGRARFFDPGRNWQPNITLQDSPSYRAQDAALLLETQIELPFTANLYTAQQILQQAMKRSRFGVQVGLTATIAATQLEIGDVVPVTHSMPGWVAKLFRVVDLELLYNDEVRLTLLEYDVSVYTLDALTVVAAPASTTLPDPLKVGMPGTPVIVESLYQTSGSAGVKSKASVSWAASADQFVSNGGQYQVEYQLSGASSWLIGGLVQASALMLDVFDLAEGIYNFRVRAINSVGASSVSGTTSKQLIGLSAPPSDPQNFAVQAYAGQAKFTWTKPSANTDLDVLIGGRAFVRWSPKISGATWDYGSLVNDAGYAGDDMDARGPLMTGTYLLKFRDSNGNYSVNEASFVVTEAFLTGLVTLATLTESPDFTGAKTNVAAVDAALKLDGSTLWDAIPGNIDSWGDNIDGTGGVASSGSYSFAAKMDLGSIKSCRLFATIDSIAFDTGDFWDSRINNIDSWGIVDGAIVEDAEAKLMVRATNDDPNAAPTWGPWHALGLSADYSARGFDFRLDFTSANPTHNRNVTTLSVAAKQ